MSSTLQAVEARFNSLSINSVVFNALNALFGAYVVLFILALWSIHKRQGVAYKRLRTVTIILFVVLLTHYVSRSVVAARERLLVPSANELARIAIPMQIITSTTGTLAALLSDGLLAWRFYVIYGCRRWALWGPASVIIAITVLGIAGDLTAFSFYTNPSLYQRKLAVIPLKVSFAWGWCVFVTNTILTISIVARILCIWRRSGKSNLGVDHSVVLEAIVESGAVTWVGLLLYEIAAVAPTHGRVTSAMNVGFVMVCVLPLFFGQFFDQAISQCLITVRVGLAKDGQKTAGSRSREQSLSSTENDNDHAYRPYIRKIAVTVTSESYTGARDELDEGAKNV